MLASEATLPMSQTEEEADGRVQQAPAGLAGAALLECAQEAQHGAAVAAERHVAERKAELQGALVWNDVLSHDSP